MRTDRYLRIVLTIIAIELLWLGVKDLAPGVSAQAVQAPPMRVVIAGIEIDPRDGDLLPVVVAGQVRGGVRASLEPVQVRVAGTVPVEARGTVKVEADRPLKIEADRPLRVESVPYTPGVRPGE